MNEKTVLKQSFILFVIGIIIFSIIGIVFKDISYPLGFLLGFIFNTVVFYVIIFTSDMILNLKKSVSLIVIMNIGKLIIYAIGFLLAIFFPKVFNIVGVFFGYMITKLSIFVANYFSGGR
ncbi:MAG: hypothetical protein ACI4SR_07195 [Faecalibacillus sp.]